MIIEDQLPALPPGACLTFIMESRILDCVNSLAKVFNVDRGLILLATVTGDGLDPASPIFVWAEYVEVTSSVDGWDRLKLSIEVDGKKATVRLTSSQQPQHMPHKDIISVSIQLPSEPPH